MNINIIEGNKVDIKEVKNNDVPGSENKKSVCEDLLTKKDYISTDNSVNESNTFKTENLIACSRQERRSVTENGYSSNDEDGKNDRFSDFSDSNSEFSDNESNDSVDLYTRKMKLIGKRGKNVTRTNKKSKSSQSEVISKTKFKKCLERRSKGKAIIFLLSILLHD